MGKIGFHNAFFSTEVGVAGARRQIEDELLNFCVVNEAPKSAFGKSRKTYTGKLYGKQDDLCITLQLALIAAQRFFQEPRYAQFRDG